MLPTRHSNAMPGACGVTVHSCNYPGLPAVVIGLFGMGSLSSRGYIKCQVHPHPGQRPRFSPALGHFTLFPTPSAHTLKVHWLASRRRAGHHWIPDGPSWWSPSNSMV